jgi:hypothetical protein
MLHCWLQVKPAHQGLPALQSSPAQHAVVLQSSMYYVITFNVRCYIVDIICRYNQHTKDCPHCRAALRNTEIAIGLLAVAGAVAAGTLVVAAVNAAAAAAANTAAAAAAGTGGVLPLLPFGAAAKLAAAAAAVAAIAGAAVAGLLRFRQLFIFSDYVHAAR